jgi:hypothetical protein
MQYGSSNLPPAQAPKPPVPGGVGSSPTSMKSAATQEYQSDVDAEGSIVSSVKKLLGSIKRKKSKK